MIKFHGRFGKEVCLAISGGQDSMVAYNFLSRKHDVIPMFFNHGTIDCANAEKFLVDIFGKKLRIGTIGNPKKPDGKSLEEHWRTERYKWLDKNIIAPLITAHHLDDQIETYLFSALNGKPKLMKFFNKMVYRPFLLTRKQDLVDWGNKYNVPYVHDTSNDDVSKRRNYIRKFLVPHALQVNPGLHKVIRRMTEISDGL